MEERVCKAIELDKILGRLAARAVCPETARAALALRPMTQPDEVRGALAQTDAMTVRLLRDGTPRYSACEGAQAAVRRAAKGGMLNMGQLLLVACALRNFRYLSDWYRRVEDPCLLDDLFRALAPQPELERAIYDSILSDTEMADTASVRLGEIRGAIARTEAGIRQRLEDMTRDPQTLRYLQDPVVSMRGGRFVVPVRLEHRADVGGVIHDVSASGSTLFVEPTAVAEANAKILQLRNQEKEEIERILRAFTAQVAALETLFLYSYDAMLALDMLLAKAALALDMRAVCPAVNDAQAFSLLKARHPLIDSDRVVPVDVELGFDYDTLIITGPNTGGKTVTLKTAGLLCAMAQCGMLIPAHERSSVCIFADTLVDIGDEQSIEQSLSTFSGHLKNISTVLQRAAADTLVLLDELGAGTDPAEGAALAVAVIERLRRTGARIMATTHYGEMKVFALETPGVQNASCEFDVESLRPTYRLSVGVPGKSNAFLISRRLGIPEDVIRQAQQHLSQEDKRLDEVLGQLDELKLRLKAGEEEMERLRHEADHQVAAGKRRREELERQGAAELEAARQAAHQMAQSVQNDAYALMDELKKLQKQQDLSVQQRLQRARQIARQDSEKLYKAAGAPQAALPRTPLAQVQRGQQVLVGSLGQTGVVLDVSVGGVAQVQVGAMKLRVPCTDLFAAAEKAPAAKQPPRRQRPAGEGDNVRREGHMEIQLLGLTVEEAILEADRFIDGALRSGLHTVYLIHGKGTGALRAGLHRHLRTPKGVRSFRLGNYGEGESGVTVVELE